MIGFNPSPSTKIVVSLLVVQIIVDCLAKGDLTPKASCQYHISISWTHTPVPLVYLIRKRKSYEQLESVLYVKRWDTCCTTVLKEIL